MSDVPPDAGMRSLGGNVPRGAVLDRRDFLRLTGAAAATVCLPVQAGERRLHAADVCVYGGNASGIVAAVAAARGKAVACWSSNRVAGSAG
jgi:hypothetical protein